MVWDWGVGGMRDLVERRGGAVGPLGWDVGRRLPFRRRRGLERRGEPGDGRWVGRCTWRYWVMVLWRLALSSEARARPCWIGG